VLVQRIEADVPAHASIVVAVTWAAAFAVYVIASRIASRQPMRQPDAFVRAGLVFPSVGLALLLPITIHLPFLAFGKGGGEAFDEWARLSLEITGPAHIALAVLVTIRAFQLAASDHALSPWTIYFLTILVSCIPYAFLLFIPPTLVAITGIPMLAVMKRLATIAGDERAETEDVPHAIAIVRAAS
jgi:hypothetical protein